MPKFLHSVAVQSRTIAADAVEQYDLSVNPLSVVLIRLTPLNSGANANNVSYLNIAAALNRVRIMHQGTAVVSLPGQDLAALAYFRHGIMPTQATMKPGDNIRRCVVVPVLLGRHAYDRHSCFPRTRRGELVLELDYDVAGTGYDGFDVQVDTIELLDASPKEFERKTQVSASFATTGLHDVDLPIGNKVRSLLAWGNTEYTGATPAPTLGRMETLIDNESIGFSSVDFETLHMVHTLFGRQPPAMDDHTHDVDATAANTTEVSQGPWNVGQGGWQNYCLLDFDPAGDDQFALDLSKVSRFTMRSNVETADAYRITTIEAVKV